MNTVEDFLVTEGVMTAEQVNRLAPQCTVNKAPLFDWLSKQKHIDEIALSQKLSHFYNVGFIEPTQAQADDTVANLLPGAFVSRYQVFPIHLDSGMKRLEVLMLEPDRLAVLDEIALLTGCRAVPRLTTPTRMFTLLRGVSHYNASAEKAMALAEEAGREDLQGAQTTAAGIQQEIAANDAPVVQLVNAVLAEAIHKNASDIHIESHRETMIVRFRIDGILRDIRTIPKNIARAVISRIKVTSGMDIAEHRRPQDGRIRFTTGDLEVDMRVNTLAVQYGESVVIRLLRANATAVGLEQLGLHKDSSRRLIRMTHAPNGIILVTGPTGSGKTTTLYSCLREINTRERKILTIEDPIEYPLAGINQTQVSQKAGLNFAVALRAMMRQDPDVILLGEIRDKETLEAAMHAALTGHLVFSTIHTNSTAKTITRLMEMGAAPYLISSTVCGIVAQRLIRKICEQCKTAYQANAEELKVLGFHGDVPTGITVYKGTGCAACEQTGYQGRVGLYETMEVTRSIQELIDANASSGTIEDAAIREGMITLSMDGEHKIAAGQTTVEEVNRVLGTGW